MRFNKQVFFSALVVIVLAVLVCFRFFGDVILHADEFLFGASGDGLKNYFAVAFQVIHGEGSWFTGMLYPYGDLLVFADGQPLLTEVLSWFIEPDVNNGTQIIAIMNLLMLGSLVATAWCIHRLLVWNYVNPWFAVPFSITIAFLSPQVARFIGHYALAYIFFVPMGWLLIAGFSRTKWPWIWALVVSTVVLLFGFLHPYYLFIFVIFLGATVGWEVLINKLQFKKVKYLLARGFTILAPLVLFMAYQKWVDPYTVFLPKHFCSGGRPVPESVQLILLPHISANELGGQCLRRDGSHVYRTCGFAGVGQTHLETEMEGAHASHLAACFESGFHPRNHHLAVCDGAVSQPWA